MKNVVIFGDSYSTFKEYIPEGFETYYPSLDVNSVEETWWNRLKKKNDFCLVQNNSWSGSTICYTGYGNSDCSKTSSFIYRYRKLKEESFFDKNPIDTIFVFGGTNDSWANVELGECMLDSWKEEALFYVRPAISYFVSTLKKDMPFANIIVVINTQIKQEIKDWFKQVAKYYGCSFVELKNVDKQDGHPTVKGMQDICEQIYSATI